jgi:hypothetical protein
MSNTRIPFKTIFILSISQFSSGFLIVRDFHKSLNFHFSFFLSNRSKKVNPSAPRLPGRNAEAEMGKIGVTSSPPFHFDQLFQNLRPGAMDLGVITLAAIYKDRW